MLPDGISIRNGFDYRYLVCGGVVTCRAAVTHILTLQHFDTSIPTPAALPTGFSRLHVYIRVINQLTIATALPYGQAITSHCLVRRCRKRPVFW